MSDVERQKFGAADSMEAAAAILSRADAAELRLGVDELKRAKGAGCPAFRGSRVYLDELLEWWSVHGDSLPSGDPELDNIAKLIQQEKLRKAKFDNDIAEGKYILRTDQADKLGALGLEIKAVLRKKIEDEYPDRAVGKTREQILHLGRELVDEICRNFQEGVAKW